MGILDDTIIFATVVKQGGFSHAAKYLGLSNGLVSRRIANLETELGVTLIKRTTRQLSLTPEGKVFWRHAQRIQQELECARSVIQSLAEKPKGHIRITAPLYFGRQYLTPILSKFQANFSDIKIDLMLTNQKLDPVKENLDLIIRSMGYMDNSSLEDSNMHMKLLIKQKVGLYACPEYLMRVGEPTAVEDLSNHDIIGHMDNMQFAETIPWVYTKNNRQEHINLKPKFTCNDVESSIMACIAGQGIGKFAELAAQQAVQNQRVHNCPEQPARHQRRRRGVAQH